MNCATGEALSIKADSKALSAAYLVQAVLLFCVALFSLVWVGMNTPTYFTNYDMTYSTIWDIARWAVNVLLLGLAGNTICVACVSRRLGVRITAIISAVLVLIVTGLHVVILLNTGNYEMTNFLWEVFGKIALSSTPFGAAAVYSVPLAIMFWRHPQKGVRRKAVAAVILTGMALLLYISSELIPFTYVTFIFYVGIRALEQILSCGALVLYGLLFLQLFRTGKNRVRP